jgi:hypothetical protein
VFGELFPTGGCLWSGWTQRICGPITQMAAELYTGVFRCPVCRQDMPNRSQVGGQSGEWGCDLPFFLFAFVDCL